MKKILFFALLSSTVFSETLQKIQITGNKRIESDTIKSYLHIQIGNDFEVHDAEQALKTLMKTGYFSKVDAQKDQGVLKISVIENPTINQIAYEGNDALKDEQIAKDMPIKPRKILSMADVQNVQQRLLEIYRRMGYFSATVDPKIIKLDHNRVNLIFEIKEGTITTIDKIVFLGNNKFSSVDLEETLLSKRSKWWRFFASDDRYDPDRLMADQQALRQYYNNKGYPDFRVVNASAELSEDRKSFYLTFVVDEGELYKFGKVSFQSAIKEIDTSSLLKELFFVEGDVFNAKELEKSINLITEKLGEKGYAFVIVEPIIEKDKTNKIASVTFSIKEGPRVYIDRVQISGNDRTHDQVLRREMTLHEGDIFNTSKMKHSENSLKDLDYFKEVTIDTEQSDSYDRVNLLVKVQEQSTGNVRLSGGYSTTDGPLISFGLSERNFMGKGQTVNADVSLSKKTQDFTIGIVEPYLFNKRLVGSFDLFSHKSSRHDAFTTKTIGFSGGIGYGITPNLVQKWNYTLQRDQVSSVDGDASLFLLDDPKKSVLSSIAHTLKYDRRDSIIEPTKGYILSMANTFAGVGGSVSYLRHDFSAIAFHTLLEDVLTFIRFDCGFLQKAKGRRLRVVDGIYLGGDSFKGFEFSGLGPRDIASKNKDSIGGQKYWKTTLESQFSIGVPAEFGIKGALFVQTGSVWDSPFKRNIQKVVTIKKKDADGKEVEEQVTRTTHLIDNRKTRVSVGFGVIWKGPFGPLRIDYAVPVVKSKIDQTQRINLSYHLPL